jgi:predicted nucleotidyltransferase/predicted transcriptional regulator
MVEKLANIFFKILAFYRTNYSNRTHARAIAKNLNLSHVALLPHLKQLQELKILNAQTEGRNKQYTLNKGNSLTQNYLIITEEIATINYLEKTYFIKKLSEYLNLANIFSPLILFGSYVKGYATEESDIDLFCIGKLTDTQHDYLRKFEATYGKKINIKTTNPENFQSSLQNGDILIKEVIANHIILSNPDPFVSLLWRNYIE